MKRLIEQSACVHRQFNVCTFLLDSGEPCPGGTSREVEVDYGAGHEVLVQRGVRGVGTIDSGLAHQVVDAALGGGW